MTQNTKEKVSRKLRKIAVGNEMIFVSKAIDLTLTEVEKTHVSNRFFLKKLKEQKEIDMLEVGKVIDEITYGCGVVLNETARCGDISFGNEILLCNKCRVYYDKIQNIKQKLRIK